MTTGNRNLMPFPNTDADGSPFGGMDWSLPGDYGMLFDLNDPMLQSQYELDPAIPSLLLDPTDFTFAPADDNAFVDPSDLRNFPPVSYDATPPLAVPFIYTSQTQASPLQSPLQQEPQTHKHRTKKLESGFPCTHPGCTRCFDRACDLRKHFQRTHTPQEKRQWKCPHPGCSKRFIWPKDVTRHRRQVHGEDLHHAPSPPPTSDLSPATTRASGGSSVSNPSTLPPKEKNFSGPPAKRQRQLLSALPGKLSTTLWLCRSVVLLKGLRLRRKSTRSEDSAADDNDGELDAPGEVVDEGPENGPVRVTDTKTTVAAAAAATAVTATTTATTMAGREKVARTTATAPQRWLLITRNRVNFRAVEVTGADTADEVMGRVRRAAGAVDGLELALRELSFRDGVRDVLSGEGLMRAVHQHAGERNGLMLLLTPETRRSS